jgi:hypothetical protein
MATTAEELVAVVKKKIEERNHRIQNLEIQVRALKQEVERLRQENSSHRGLVETLQSMLEDLDKQSPAEAQQQ